MKTAIHQYCSALDRSSPVGRRILSLQNLLIAAGHISQILVDEPGRQEAPSLRGLTDYQGDSCALLLIHDSSRRPSAGLLKALPDRLLLVSHEADAPTPSGSVARRAPSDPLLILRDRVERAFVDGEAALTRLRRLGYFDAELLPSSTLKLIRILEATLARKPSRASLPPPRLRIQIDGPFDTSYGLAVANRRLALALHRQGTHDIVLNAIDGPGSYAPRSHELFRRPALARLWEKSFVGRLPDVILRNMYPPRFERSSAALNLAFFFWEDSLLPAGWAADFNRAFDGVLAPSRFVATVLRESGVTLPVEIVPPPVEEGPRQVRLPDLPSSKTTFLSIGSAFPRKGTDVLLRAYFRTFCTEDDVLLVLKTFPNPHNTVAEQIAALRQATPRPPRVVHLDHEVEDQDIEGLYRRADVFVHPARAEGFGLPVAEAMLRQIPVIATSAGGLADFCDSETCFVVPHRPAPSGSHFCIPGAEWAEPDEDSLCGFLKGFADGKLQDEALRRADRARQVVRETFSSVRAARRAEDAIERLWLARAQSPRVAHLTTWGGRCGIAQYAEDLLNALDESQRAPILASSDMQLIRPDRENVRRIWTQVEADYSRILNAFLETGADLLHVQFHPALFSDYPSFASLLDTFRSRGVPVVVTAHLLGFVKYRDTIYRLRYLKPSFSRLSRILVHGAGDLQRLEEMGISDNVTEIPFGGPTFSSPGRVAVARSLGVSGRRIIASFGYGFPHKGYLETIEAIALLREKFPSILFLALAGKRPEWFAADYAKLCRKRIEELHLEDSVWYIDTFLPSREVATLLAAAEVIVLPYRANPESASAAVRFPLAVGRATVTTSEPIFRDVRGAVHQIPDGEPRTIAAAIQTILENESLRVELEEKARAYAEDHSWNAVAALHRRIYNEVMRDANQGSEARREDSIRGS